MQNNKSKYVKGLLAATLMLGVQPVWAAGPPTPSLFSNPMAVILIIIMVLLLVIIGVLARMVTGAAELKMKKKKLNPAAASAVILFLMLSPSLLFAQDAGTADPVAEAAAQSKTIAGMSPGTFYIMIAVLFIELLIIIALLLSVKSLLRKEKNRVLATTGEGYAADLAEAVAAEKDKLSWWDKFNSLRPSSEEADLDLGHDYDGIRELNNRLPGWWLYGFYGCIIFAGIYLWRYHVSHTAPLSKQEYEISVAKAEAKVQEYLKMKGDVIDENNVTYLSTSADLDAGKAIFEKPGFCSTCHGTDGSGLVNGAPGIGPNLTDNFWINGDGTIKTVFAVVKNGGRSGKGMQAWSSNLTAKEMAQVSSYVKSLATKKPSKGKDTEPEAKEYKQDTAPATDSVKAVTDSLKK
ncbi:MAG: c-type cytochrome [Chitinophagaceae bacterium]|nr:c-type cytochrome [Chitinophagaceae bacterium]